MITKIIIFVVFNFFPTLNPLIVNLWIHFVQHVRLAYKKESLVNKKNNGISFTRIFKPWLKALYLNQETWKLWWWHWHVIEWDLYINCWQYCATSIGFWIIWICYLEKSSIIVDFPIIYKPNKVVFIILLSIIFK